MRRAGKLRKLAWGITLSAALGMGAPAGASTFARMGLQDLVAENSLIVVGEVVSSRSYWNGPRTIILTDVQVSVSEILKGKLGEPEITVTLPGGTVDGETVAVIGGAELTPGSSYVLFLRQGDLPGARGVRVIREHSQGVFEIQLAKDGLHAISQATRLSLIPDGLGNTVALGGAQGMPFQSMRQSVRDLAERGARKEVKP